MTNQENKNQNDSNNPRNARVSANADQSANAQNSENKHQPTNENNQHNTANEHNTHKATDEKNQHNNPTASDSTGRTQTGSQHTPNAQHPQGDVAGRTMGQGGNLNSRINPSEIKSQLKDLTFPASKEQILKLANRQGLDGNVLTALNELPNQTFNSASEVASSLTK